MAIEQILNSLEQTLQVCNTRLGINAKISCADSPVTAFALLGGATPAAPALVLWVDSDNSAAETYGDCRSVLSVSIALVCSNMLKSPAVGNPFNVISMVDEIRSHLIKTPIKDTLFDEPRYSSIQTLVADNGAPYNGYIMTFTIAYNIVGEEY